MALTYSMGEINIERNNAIITGLMELSRFYNNFNFYQFRQFFDNDEDWYKVRDQYDTAKKYLNKVANLKTISAYTLSSVYGDMKAVYDNLVAYILENYHETEPNFEYNDFHKKTMLTFEILASNADLIEDQQDSSYIKKIGFYEDTKKVVEENSFKIFIGAIIIIPAIYYYIKKSKKRRRRRK